MTTYYNPSFFDVFDPVQFKNANEHGCSPVYTWVWNCEINSELIDTQITEMYDAGIRAFYVLPEPCSFRPGWMDTYMTPAYLSEAFFSLIRYTAECAKAKNMTVWVYDEAGWPSGAACGAVTQALPDCMTRYLAERSVALDAGDTFAGTLSDEEIISTFLDGARVTLPFTAKTPCTLQVIVCERPVNRFPYLLDQRAIREFLSCTYDKYYECLGDLFGTTVQAVFTDEAILHYPFYLEPEDLTAFETQTGYCFADMVYGIFHPDTASYGRFKADYIDYCCSLFAKRYLAALHQWCLDRKVAFTGHMNGDHLLSCYDMSVGNVMTHLRHMDMPGIDTISRHIHAKTQAANFPRFASSAAAQTGKKGVLSESLAVYGSLPFDEIRYICASQLTKGINVLNFMVIPAGRDRFLGAQERPDFLPQDADHEYLKECNEYLARLQYLCRTGHRCAQVAVYAPMRDVWAVSQTAEDKFWQICKTLEEHQISYDIIDDDFLAQAVLSNSCALCMGDARYTHLCVQDTLLMRADAREKLDAFLAAGGHVLTIKEPQDALPDKLHILPRTLFGNDPFLRVQKQTCQNGHLYLLFNESPETRVFTVATKESEPGYHLDCTTGTLHPLDTCQSFSFTLTSGEVFAMFFPVSQEKEKGTFQGETVFCPKPLTCEAFSSCADFSSPKETLRLAVPNATLLSKTYFEKGTLRKEACNIPLEAPTAQLSGTLGYHISFPCPALPASGEVLRLDLGQVMNCCKVWLNGHFLGSLLFAPYVITVDSSLITENNVLEIRVSNTSAAAYVQADLSDQPDAAIGPYHEVALTYEKEHLTCGICSPYITLSYCP